MISGPMTKQRTTKTYAGGPLMLELESRVLLSADLSGATLADDAVTERFEDRDDMPIVAGAADAESAIVTAADSEIRELVVIDSATPDASVLLADLLNQMDDGRTIEVFVLDGGRDGIDQVSELLADRDDIGALHIISHGRDGGVLLGDTVVDQDELVARATAIRGWSDAFTDDADILIYGCHLAAGDDGRAFVGALARLTDADVAASDDLTGSDRLGGDWDLEYATGRIDAQLAISAEARATYDAVLPVVTVDPLTTNDATPALSGTVDDTTATIDVSIDGNTYAATNNGDGHMDARR